MQKKTTKTMQLLETSGLSAMAYRMTRDGHRLKKRRLRLEIRKHFPNAKGGSHRNKLNHSMSTTAGF